jgi:long-chain acyl-CoA synthetase
MSTAADDTARSYDGRPWQSLYRPGDPHEIEPAHHTAVEMFLATAASAPDATAIHYFGTELTWSDLDAQSTALAAALQSLGVEHGDRVALYLQNVPQTVVGMLGVWKAAAVILFVNPMMKQREIVKQFGEIEPKVLITLESLYGDVIQHVRDDIPVRDVITTSELDHLGGAVPEQLAGSRRQRHEETYDFSELLDRYAGTPPEPVELKAGDLAQIMYTSGSTGLPKAAMSTHGNVVFNAHAYRHWLALSSDDLCYAVSPLVHVTGSVGFVATAMAAAMPIVLAYRFYPEHFMETVERLKVTYTICTHTGLIAVMDHPDSRTRDLSSLTKLVSAQVESVMQAWEDRYGTYVYSIYGSTECTSPTVIVPMDRRAPKDPKTGKRALGVPIYNTMIRVVDGDGVDVPVGEQGEFVVSGPQVGRGYWNRPDLDVFRDGVYFTGDLGYMDPDGWFHIVDRKKDMIDASGFKVSPLEVENVLYEHPAVREAAVLGVPDPRRGQTVKAFVSLEPGTAAEPEELMEFCRERIAAYKYPRLIEIWDDLPKSDIGKIVKSQLPRS